MYGATRRCWVQRDENVFPQPLRVVHRMLVVARRTVHDEG
jgi:hypothetical protein